MLRFECKGHVQDILLMLVSNKIVNQKVQKVSIASYYMPKSHSFPVMQFTRNTTLLPGKQSDQFK